MRIQIKSEDGNIDIPIPTGLVFSKAAAWTWLKIVRKATSRYLPQKIGKKADSVMDALSDEAVYALCAELMRIKRKYGKWDLVEVESADGEQVLIQL